MSQPKKADVPATLTVEHDCGRRCQTEFDLEGIHIRYTLGMMLTAVAAAHTDAHAAEPAVRVFAGHNGILVRAGVLAVAHA